MRACSSLVVCDRLLTEDAIYDDHVLTLDCQVRALLAEAGSGSDHQPDEVGGGGGEGEAPTPPLAASSSSSRRRLRCSVSMSRRLTLTRLLPLPLSPVGGSKSGTPASRRMRSMANAVELSEGSSHAELPRRSCANDNPGRSCPSPLRSLRQSLQHAARQRVTVHQSASQPVSPGRLVSHTHTHTHT